MNNRNIFSFAASPVKTLNLLIEYHKLMLYVYPNIYSLESEDNNALLNEDNQAVLKFKRVFI